MSEAGEFREAGYFRIDRAKALEKLSAFQLERGEQFLLPLARCAAAAGARLLKVQGRTSLQAVFDGEPFTRAELEDPYGALFIPDSDPRRRHFAAFLLGALRTRPKEVRVASGRGAERHVLRASGLEGESVASDAGGDVDTVVSVGWGALGWVKRRAEPAKRAAREAWVLTPPGFTVDGAAPWERPSPGRLVRLEDYGGLRLRLQPPDDPSRTRITFCSLGVAVETIATLLPDAQVRAWVNDDAFALTASQSAVVEDVRRQKALDAVASGAAEFLPETARRLTAALPTGRSASAGPGWAEEARAWFAATALRLSSERRTLPQDLWEAPFLTDASGRALSLADAGRGKTADGKLAYSTSRVVGARLPSPVVHCPRPADLALLESVFPGSLHDATQLVESLGRLT